jgi:hypothetical protein
MILDETAAAGLGRRLLDCGDRLVRRRGVLDDDAALEEIARVMAEGLRLIEGRLGRFVFARPAAVPAETVAGGPSPALLDGEVA